ncbi:MAG: hypothetical protein IJC11_05720 [Alphaproteobacteria bacterium]|nr:hypothetical protein [Alphaproteobacteria bacterium]
MQKYEKQFEITSDECNEYGKLRLRSLFNLFQAMADNHAHLLGVGYQYCIQNGLGWIGGGYAVEINKLPTWGDTVLLKTWPAKTTAVTAIREFEMTNVQTGEVLVRASSQWVLIDTIKKRPISVVKHLQGFELITERAVDTSFPKLPELDRADIEFSQIIRTDDIDLNHHVNNAVYPTWILDALPENYLSNNRIVKLQIQYKNPAQKGDNIVVQTQMKDNNNTLHIISNLEKSTEFARVVVDWKKR